MYVVVVKNPDGSVSLVGTPHGKAFASERNANACAKRLDKNHNVQFVGEIEAETNA